jgi:hypothetical protein
MLTYNQLIEIKLNDLSDSAKLDDFEKAAGGQGIKLGRREKKGHHVDYPDAKHRDGRAARTQDNKVIGGSATGDKKSSKMEKGTHQKKLKDAVIAGHKPRVNQKAGQENVGYWKNPDKKEQRIADAKRNKEAKRKKRNPFTREHSEWWLNMWRIDEATEEQIALQKQRQADRVAKGGKGAEGSGGTHFHQGQAEKNRRIKQGKAPNLNTTSTPGQPKKETPRGVSPSEASRATSNVKGTQRTAGLGRRTGQTGTTREATGRQKGGDLAKRPVTSTSPGAGALAKRGEVIPASGGQKPDRKSNTYRQANKEATPKPKKPENQFAAGLKTSMGGDVFSKNDAVRKRSRRELGKKTGKAIRSVPGKAVSAGVSAGRKALDLGKKSVTDGPGSSGPDSVQGSSEIIRGRRG